MYTATIITVVFGTGECSQNNGIYLRTETYLQLMLVFFHYVGFMAILCKDVITAVQHTSPLLNTFICLYNLPLFIYCLSTLADVR